MWVRVRVCVCLPAWVVGVPGPDHRYRLATACAGIHAVPCRAMPSDTALWSCPPHPPILPPAHPAIPIAPLVAHRKTLGISGKAGMLLGGQAGASAGERYQTVREWEQGW